MSNERYTQGGRVDPKTLPKGPNGRALCRRCQQEVPAGRRTFCGDVCVVEWCIRTGKSVQKLVWRRDRGVCASCAKDCGALEAELRALARRHGHRSIHVDRWLAQHQVPRHRRRLWDVDHITPVELGGGECGLAGLQTLCLACHRVKTREQAIMRAARKAAAKSIP